MIKIRRALLSVSDKTGLVELGKALAREGVQLLSTGGTASALRDAGVAVTDVSDVTGFPECLDGRVKTLHPRIHAGILADRSKPTHRDQLADLEVDPIDLVVVNLYPFESVGETADTPRVQLIETIDIGGPTMLRAAAKNCDHVVTICDPKDYVILLELIRGGGVPLERSRDWAVKVFARTASYDAAVAARLEREMTAPPRDEERVMLPLGLHRAASLRYGENPHQTAGFYRPAGVPAEGLAALKQLQGKALSFNNYLDMNAAYGLVHAYEDGAAVVVKHLNPCGLGFHEDPVRAYRRALACDPLSAFGGIVALNRPLNEATARALVEIFLEVVIAPRVDESARAVLAGKKNLRVIEASPAGPPLGWDVRSVSGGWLVQRPDGEAGDRERTIVTERKPSAEEARALERAWVAVRHARSNAIVIGAEDGLIGLGCGQTSRVDAVRHAAEKASRAELAPAVRVLASDAFFPFRDGIDAAAESGATAVIQPGGSVRDQEVVAAANEHGMAMVLTGRRSFRH